MHIIRFSLLLILITIPIHVKNSTPKLSSKFSTFFSKTKEEIIHHEFNKVEKLDITNIHGNISVETWKQPCVLIEVRKKGATKFLQQTKLSSCLKNHTLTGCIDIADGAGKGSVHVHILVPEQLPLKLTTTHGTVFAKSHNGPLDITTQWGNITIKDGNNTVLAKTVQGQILVQRKKMSPGHALNLQTDHGNIELQIPQEFEADMQAHANHGKITSDLFITLHSQTTVLNDETFKQMKHHVYGWIGQPQNTKNPVTLLLQSDYGMINISPYPNKKSKK